MTTPLYSLIILLIVSIGFAYYISLAQKRRSSQVDEFFVAGRNIGLPLFTHTTWGTSFAFGNSIFYAVWLGYSIGLSAIWVQILWAAGMVAYAFLLPRLIGYTENFTLHGFLGSMYGKWCRIIASVVSVIGLLICLGFEISFAAQYFAQVTNLQHFEWLIVLAFATFIATFCSIGGFKANTITDKFSNYLAVGTMILLPTIMLLQNNEVIMKGFSPSLIWKSLSTTNSSILYYVSLGLFAFFNIIDMSNWQNVSANSLNEDKSTANLEQRKKMRGAMFKAAGLFLLAPVLLGTILGYMFRILSYGGINDQTVFMSKLVGSLIPQTSILAVIVLGIITFAFLASSLSGSDSWLLASTQTISWDLLDYKKFKQKGFKVAVFDQGLHQIITKHAKMILMVIGIGGASFVYYISKYLWGDVFALQFVIFGGGLAMLPALLYGIFRGNSEKSKIISVFALFSIAVGYGSGIALFIRSLILKDPDVVTPLPLYTLGVSTSIFLIGFLVDLIFKRVAKLL